MAERSFTVAVYKVSTIPKMNDKWIGIGHPTCYPPA